MVAHLEYKAAGFEHFHIMRGQNSKTYKFIFIAKIHIVPNKRGGRSIDSIGFGISNGEHRRVIEHF